MGKTMKTGFGKSTERRSPMAPTMAGGMPQGVLGRSPSAAPERGKLIKKGNSKNGDALLGANRTHRVQNFERHGAQQRITVPLRLPAVPEAAPTQANGRPVKSYPKLQDSWGGAGFWDASRGG
jgi:hypothetical protein